jgi:hypothetical protein
MNMQNTRGEYEGVQMIGMLMMHIVGISHFRYLMQLAAAFCFYFISGTTELIF